MALGGVAREDVSSAAALAQLAPVFRAIQANHAESLRVRDLAQLVGLHPAWFSTRFKQLTGLAPARYLLRYRLERVRELLLSTDRPVRPVCSGAKYANVPTIRVWWLNSVRISAKDIARAKSTTHAAPVREITTFAGAMSRCITPRRCILATARANPTASPISSSTSSGVESPTRLVPSSSSMRIEPG